MNYLEFQIKAGIVLLVLYIIYQSLISRSNWFRNKRLFLLFSLLAAFIVPFISISIKSSSELIQYVILPEVVVSIVNDTPRVSGSFSVQAGISVALILISTYLLISFIAELYRIFRLIRFSEKSAQGSFTLVKTPKQEAFSFFNYIFLGKLIPEDKVSVILEHELVHVRQVHSFDNFVINILIIMQWFNPVVWLFCKSMKENHEYEADSTMLANGACIEAYQQLLLNQIFQTNNVKFSSFNHNSFIKNRIKMMKQINQRSGKTRFLLATILSIFVISVFSFQAEIAQMSDEVKIIAKPAAMSRDTLKNLKKEKPFIEVDEPATFRGKGLEEFNKFVIENVKYPKEAVQKNMQGKIYIQFVVEADGSVREAKVVRGVGLILDEEAVRVVKSSPAWTPAKKNGKNVRQLFTLPVVFKLQG